VARSRVQACAGGAAVQALQGYSSTVLCYGQTGKHPLMHYWCYDLNDMHSQRCRPGLRRQSGFRAGSGKTFTMLGEPGNAAQRGLAARVLHEVQPWAAAFFFLKHTLVGVGEWYSWELV